MGAARALGLLLGAAADAALRESPRPPVRPTSRPGLIGTAAAAVALERLSAGRPLLRTASTAAATWLVLGGRRLAAEGAAIGRAIDAGELDTARARLPAVAGHDPATLDAGRLAKVAVESVAVRTSRVVVAPLLWGAVAGVPGLIGYRVIGRWADADPAARRPGRVSEAVDVLPTRLTAALTVAAAPVVGGSSRDAWLAWRRDAVAHPAPNDGRVQAAFAGALQIRLGGRTVHPDGVRERPVLGDGRLPDAGHVTRSAELSRVVGAFAAAAAGVTAVTVSVLCRLVRR